MQMVNTKRIWYGSEITRPRCRKNKIWSRWFKLSQVYERVNFHNMRITSRCYALNSVNVKWTLNFEDEIFLRGVECNIPLVSKRKLYLSMFQRTNVHGKRAWWKMLSTTEDISMWYQSGMDLYISAESDAIKTKGILGIRTQGVFKHVWTQNIHFPFHFLSLGLRERIVLFLLSNPRPLSPL
jgi:hypothetical protein